MARAMPENADVEEQAVVLDLVLPQELADERHAFVVVTEELLPELEVCPCETLEEGYLLYRLEQAEDAAALSRIYGVARYEPTAGNAVEAYALLLPPS